MYSDQQIQIAIEIYIREGLPPESKDRLWVEFLKDEKWFKYYDAYFDLVEFLNNQ